MMRSSHIFILMALASAGGCSRAPVVTISNGSTNVLANVVVSGSGFTNRLDRIAAGGQSRLTVYPRGESGVRIEFDAGSQHVDSGEQGYFEASGGYRVTVTIDADLKVYVFERFDR